MYHHGSLESIGVGEFGPEDTRQLFELATVGPHVYQGSLRTLLTQEGLIEESVRRGVHYQCHDAASAVLGGRDGAPLAYVRLERIGAGRGGGPAMADLEGGGGGDSLGNGGGGGGGSSEDGFYGYSPRYRWRWDTSFAIGASASSRGRRTRRTSPRTARAAWGGCACSAPGRFWTSKRRCLRL